MSPAVAAVEADRQLLERLLRDLGVEREPADSAFSEYVRVLLERFLDLLPADWLRPPEGLVGEYVAVVVLGTVALGLVLLTIQLLRVRRGRPARSAAAPRIGARSAPLVRDVDWSGELDRRLADGDVRGSLEALWRWLGAALGLEESAETWTPRELLRQSRRDDLRPGLLELERLSYGPAAPRADQVRVLRARLAERLA